MNGKGSAPRPYSVSKTDYDANWALAFGPKKQAGKPRPTGQNRKTKAT